VNGWSGVLRPTDEVADALSTGRPLVALESTLLSHGLPFPQNLEVARDAERAVRDAGAVPATIAIVEGCIRVGLDDAALERLASARDVAKVSRRSLAAALARRGWGATTVSATMIAAAAAGIRVFATGGVGGVHRGHPSDVSADLEELARSPVAVVSAGPKAILDIPATLEYLETHGVPVVTLGQDEVPAFYSRSSGARSPIVAHEVAELATIAHLQLSLLRTGVLACVPIPESAQIPAERMNAVIDASVREADAAGVGGAELTPWLLARLAESTGGDSVRANVALIGNNAAVAGQLAVALAGRE
jgi:pseudouridine-5'-phosphate glycosidase